MPRSPAARGARTSKEATSSPARCAGLQVRDGPAAFEGGCHGLDLSDDRWRARSRVGFFDEAIGGLLEARAVARHARRDDRKLRTSLAVDEIAAARHRL